MRHIFVISDLHLGGRPDERDESGGLLRTGFQICNGYRELTGFVDWLRGSTRESPGEDLELVINGDFVDFLLEDDFDESAAAGLASSPEESDAIAQLNKIVERSRGGESRGIFDALKDFLAAGHRLTLLLGNHDVELSLPEARRRLMDLLGAHNTRFQFIYDGEAYAVGRVLIEHGNRYDRWNMIDHSKLRQERSVLSRRLPVEEKRRQERYFIPPPGTHLVTQFINRIKSHYRFVDVLKPEDHAVLPLLLALEPDRRATLSEIVEVAKIANTLRDHGLDSPTEPSAMGDLMNDSDNLSLNGILEATLGPVDSRLFIEPEISTAGDLSFGSRLRDAAAWVHQRLEPFLETTSSVSSILRLRKAKTPEDRKLKLHAALKQLNRNDSSFDISKEIPVYLNAATQTAKQGDFDVVLYGHTHLPKQIRTTVESKRPGEPDRLFKYINTGTWCDVMRLPDVLAQDYATAGATLDGFLEALKENDFRQYFRRYFCFAEVLVDEGSGEVQQAELYSFGGAGRERSAPPGLSKAQE